MFGTWLMENFSMRLVDAALPMFARHETFHPRYGWFRKAYWFAARNPSVFGRSDAPVIIGVGKNMVRSIRFWGLAAKLLVEDPEVAEPAFTRVGAYSSGPCTVRGDGMGSVHGGSGDVVAAALAT